MKTKPLALLALALLPSFFTPANADSEKIINPTNQHSYKLFTEKTQTWSKAKESCATQGGYLATITSKEENDWVWNKFNQLIPIVYGNTRHFLLGGSNSEQEGTWKWITGESWTYSNWGNNQPDNYNSNQNYIAMWKHPYAGGNNGTWDDVGITASPYLCEWNSVDEPQPPPSGNEPIYSLFQPLDNVYNALDDSDKMDGTVLGQCVYGGYCNRTSNSSAHNGVDYLVAKGTPVYAICDGTIKNVTKGGNVLNRFTVIDHSGCGEFDKLFAYYGHIDPNVSLKVGDKVEAGDEIGTVADWKTNSQLHLALNKNYVAKNWAYTTVSKSTKKDCTKDSVTQRRNLLDSKGWLDPILIGSQSGWTPAVLKGGNKSNGCNAPEQLLTEQTLPYSPWN